MGLALWVLLVVSAGLSRGFWGITHQIWRMCNTVQLVAHLSPVVFFWVPHSELCWCAAIFFFIFYFILADDSQLQLEGTLAKKPQRPSLFKWSTSTNKSMILLVVPQMFVQIHPLHHCLELHIQDFILNSERSFPFPKSMENGAFLWD